MKNVQTRCFLLLAFVMQFAAAYGQLDAPGALSDFAGCRHHTCTWVPWSAQKSFHQGDLTYAVEDIGDNDAGGDFVLKRGEKVLLRRNLKDLLASVSVVWSPDNSSFAITWSDGGAIGNFHVLAFHIDGDSVQELSFPDSAFRAFRAHHWCEDRGDNIQAYRWSADSKLLVLVLSVYPTSDCGKEMGLTQGYVVDSITGKVRAIWNVRRLNAYTRTHPEL